MIPREGDILLHHPGEGWLHFSEPQLVLVVRGLTEVLPALHEAERLVERRGWYGAGFLAYEAAPAFDPAMTTRSADGGFPLLWLALYPPPSKLAALPAPTAGSEVGSWTPCTTHGDYADCISRIKDHIASSQAYQVNYTLRLGTDFSGDAYALFL